MDRHTTDLADGKQWILAYIDARPQHYDLVEGEVHVLWGCRSTLGRGAAQEQRSSI